MRSFGLLVRDRITGEARTLPTIARGPLGVDQPPEVEPSAAPAAAPAPGPDRDLGSTGRRLDERRGRPAASRRRHAQPRPTTTFTHRRRWRAAGWLAALRPWRRRTPTSSGAAWVLRTISARDEGYRSTPLGWAARNSLADMVAFLLEREAPTNLADDEPWATPLPWARRRDHEGIARRLEAGATA